ncbi:MAG: ABC transporter permease, partial [Chloroflexi bacterium]|nr:ABC transporter permease [Chloroflexota bacterium]
LANFSIAFVLNIIVLLAFGVIPSWQTIFLPLVALPLFLLGGGIGLLTSMVTVLSIDFDQIVTRGLGLLLYLTPIIYSSDIDSELIQTLIRWNPLTYLVCSVRDIMIYGRLYDNLGFAICAGLSLIVFMVSWRIFFVSEDKIVQRMICWPLTSSHQPNARPSRPPPSCHRQLAKWSSRLVASGRSSPRPCGAAWSMACWISRAASWASSPIPPPCAKTNSGR